MAHQTRRTFLTLTTAGLVTPFVANTALADPITMPPEAASIGPTIASVTTTQPRLALTFDDGPHPTLTPRLLDILKSEGVLATFYLIGRRARAHPEIVRRIADEGHEIGNHTWSHPFLDRLSDATVFDEIDRTTNVIYEATGKAPVTFRPPYGAFTTRQRALLYRERGLPSVMWSVDPADWRRPGSSVVARRILNHAAPGAIVLSHDIHPGTVQAVPSVIAGLKSRGLQMVTLSELVGWPKWSSLRFTRD